MQASETEKATLLPVNAGAEPPYSRTLFIVSPLHEVAITAQFQPRGRSVNDHKLTCISTLTHRAARANSRSLGDRYAPSLCYIHISSTARILPPYIADVDRRVERYIDAALPIDGTLWRAHQTLWRQDVIEEAFSMNNSATHIFA
jgi:hypothetical protein